MSIQDDCTLELDTSFTPDDFTKDSHLAVQLMIEDLNENGDPKSRVSLSFLVLVSPETSGDQPKIIKPSPGVCETVYVEQTYKDKIVAKSSKQDIP